MTWAELLQRLPLALAVVAPLFVTAALLIAADAITARRKDRP